MATGVSIVVTFNTRGQISVMSLAQQMRILLSDQRGKEPHADVAVEFLDYLAEGRGFVEGIVGARFTWGTVTSHVTGRGFVAVLDDFWRELLRDKYATDGLPWTGSAPLLLPALRRHVRKKELKPEWEGPQTHEVILVLHQRGTDTNASAITIATPKPHRGPTTRELVVIEHGSLPLSMTYASFPEEELRRLRENHG